MVWPVTASFCRMGLAFGGAYALTQAGFGLEGISTAIAVGMVAYGGVTAAAVALTLWR